MTRIALFKMVGSTISWTTPWGEDSAGKDGEIAGYVRTSEWVEVDFPPRKPEEQIAQEIVQLDEKATELRAEYGVKLAAIERRKQELAAITDQRVIA